MRSIFPQQSTNKLLYYRQWKINLNPVSISLRRIAGDPGHPYLVVSTRSRDSDVMCVIFLQQPPRAVRMLYVGSITIRVCRVVQTYIFVTYLLQTCVYFYTNMYVYTAHRA